MNWGSQWAYTDQTSQNWWNLYLADEPVVEEDNQGGSSFDKRQGPNAVNPMLRMQPVPSQAKAATVQPPITVATVQTPTVKHVRQRGERIYATEAFDRRVPAIGREVDPRWLRHHQGLPVPVLDDRLVVAFQKLLRDEETEFFLMMAVIAEESYERI